MAIGEIRGGHLDGVASENLGEGTLSRASSAAVQNETSVVKSHNGAPAKPVAPTKSTGFDIGSLFAGLFNGGHVGSGPTLSFGEILGKIFCAIADALDAFANGPVKSLSGPNISKSVSIGNAVSWNSKKTGGADVGSVDTSTEAANSGESAGPEIEIARGEVGVSKSLHAEVSGRTQSDVGEAEGYARAGLNAFAGAKGHVVANRDGAEAVGQAAAGATASAEAGGSAKLAGGLAATSGNAKAEVGAGGVVSAKVAVSPLPPKAIVTVGGDSFAGARAGFEAKAGVAGLNVGVRGEAMAGVGAKAEFSAGLEDGKFKFGFGLGVSCGVGFFLRIDFEIDLKPVAKGLASFFRSLAAGLTGGKPASEVVGNALNDAVKTVLTVAPPTLKVVKGGDETKATSEDDTDKQTEEGHSWNNLKAQSSPA